MTSDAFVFGPGSTKGHSFVSVDDFSKHHDQKFLNQLEFDFFIQLYRHPTVAVLFCQFGEHAWCRRGVKRRRTFWHCLGIADAFRFFVESTKKNSESSARPDLRSIAEDAGVRAQVRESMRQLLRKAEHISTQSFVCLHRRQWRNLSRRSFFRAAKTHCQMKYVCTMPCFSRHCWMI